MLNKSINNIRIKTGFNQKHFEKIIFFCSRKTTEKDVKAYLVSFQNVSFLNPFKNDECDH